MFTVFRHELRAYFSSPTGYIAIGLFVIVISLFLWVIPGQYNVFDGGYAQLDGMFVLAPWLFILLCPALTMRLVAEEKQLHTWELLISRPLSSWQILGGKYLASWVVCIVALLPCLLHYLIIYMLAQPQGNVDGGAFAGAMLGLVFLAATNCAVGTFASSVSNSQIVAFITGVTLCFVLFYGLDLVGGLFTAGSLVHNIRQVGFHAHYSSISRGVIDSADMAYFLVVTALFLALSAWFIDRRK